MQPFQTPQHTEEDLAQTNVAKGFQSFVYISDLLRRYSFDLRVTRAGRIYQDTNTEMKLRRKLVKGDKDQNAVFEAYKTENNNNVVKASVTIGDDAFTPSMLIAATAAHMANNSDTAATRIAILFMQAAAAITAEGEKERKLIATKFNPENDPTKEAYYSTLTDITARAYAATAVGDILQYAIGDNPNLHSLSDSLEFGRKVDDEIHGVGAKDEFHTTHNVLTASISNVALSRVFQDMRVMADEIVANVGEAASVELSDVEQK